MLRHSVLALAAGVSWLSASASAGAAELVLPRRAMPVPVAAPCDCAPPVVAVRPLLYHPALAAFPPPLPVYRVDLGPSYPETVLSYALPSQPPAELDLYPYVGRRYAYAAPARRLYAPVAAPLRVYGYSRPVYPRYRAVRPLRVRY